MRNVWLSSTAVVALLAAPVLAQDHGHGPPAAGGGQKHEAPAKGHAQPQQHAAAQKHAAPQQHAAPQKHASPQQHAAPQQHAQARPQPHAAPQAHAEVRAQDHRPPQAQPQQHAQNQPNPHRAEPAAARPGGHPDQHEQRAQNRGGPPANTTHGNAAPDRNAHGRQQRQPAPDLAQLRDHAQQDRQRVVQRGLWRSSQPQARRDRPKPERRPVVVTDRAYVAQLPQRPHRFVDGCPPGRGCLPPGQVRQLYADRRPSDAWWGWQPAQDAAYRYDSGYVYRINPVTQTIVSYVPVLGGALSIGNAWPSSYAVQPAPDYYADYYGNYDQPYDYRYADNVLYGVDPQSNQIEQIAALLTGDSWTIGQPMPDGYGVYNVPYAYRDRYYDTPDASYRYDDGYIYRVDPTTQLIQAAIQLLV